MTDEEMAIKYVREHVGFNPEGTFGRIAVQLFLAGLRAGRPKWHDLRKNPKDLPRERVEVLNEDGDKVMYDVGGGQGWITYSEYYEDYIEVDEPIAWCEIPKYMKED